MDELLLDEGLKLVLGDILKEVLELGLLEADGDWLRLGQELAELDGDNELDGDMLDDGDKDRLDDAEGLKELDGLIEDDGEILADGDRLALGDNEALAEIPPGPEYPVSLNLILSIYKAGWLAAVRTYP